MNASRRHRLLSCKAGSGFREKRDGISGILEKIHRDIGIGVAYCGPSWVRAESRVGLFPVWKVCIVQPRYRARNFDAFYIFTIKFSKSQLCNFQTFQSGAVPGSILSAIRRRSSA